MHAFDLVTAKALSRSPKLKEAISENPESEDERHLEAVVTAKLRPPKKVPRGPHDRGS